MTLLAVASTRGAPGATTLACLLAWAWPGSSRRYILEADPSGGVLAARWHENAELTWEPGALELSALRGGIGGSELDACSQYLTDSVSVIPARPLGRQVEAALANLGVSGAQALAGQDARLVVADLGRLITPNSTLPLARTAAITLVVFRPCLEQVQTVLNTASDLHAEGVRVGLVGVGAQPYRAVEVAERAGVEFVAELPDDPRSARAFQRHGFSWRGLKRSPLGRAAKSLANGLAEQCSAPIQSRLRS